MAKCKICLISMQVKECPSWVLELLHYLNDVFRERPWSSGADDLSIHTRQPLCRAQPTPPPHVSFSVSL